MQMLCLKVAKSGPVLRLQGQQSSVQPVVKDGVFQAGDCMSIVRKTSTSTRRRAWGNRKLKEKLHGEKEA